MIHRSKYAGFVLEPLQAVGVLCQRARQHFDGDVSPKAGVFGAIHLAHRAGAERRGNFVWAKFCSRRERHESRNYTLRKTSRDSVSGLGDPAGHTRGVPPIKLMAMA